MKNQLMFEHFKPSYADQQLCTNHFSMIEDLAPADSTIQMIVKKMADGTFHTIIDIKAFCGKFYSEAQDIASLKSIQIAKKSILGKISDWKSLRFKTT
ncbi:MAG: hypothetical protein H7061_12490 [Bdellovibrionaceae bacterium]|nr:hypothetical protein [Bdellovibrio sp.]